MSRLPWQTVLAVLALALGLRVASISYGLDFGDPRGAIFNANLDERGMILEELELLNGDWRPGLFVMRGTAPFYVDGLADAAVTGALSLTHGEPWSRTVARLRENPSPLFLVHRLLTTLASVLTVWVLMRLVGREVGPRAGLLTGLFAACAYLPVHLSHLGVIDPGWVLFACLALDRLLAFLRARRPRDLLLAGVWIGVSGSWKYPGGLLGTQLVLAWWLARRSTGREAPRRPSGALLLGTLAACLGTFLAINHHILVWPQEFLDAVRLQAETLHMESEGAIHWRALLAHLRTSVFLGVGEPVAVLGALGFLIALCRGDSWRLLALLSLLVVPTAMIAATPSPRFALGLATVSLPFAALALEVGTSRLRRPARVLLTGACLLPSLARSASFDVILTRPDTRTEMLQVVTRLQVPREDVIAIGHRGLPDPFGTPPPFVDLLADLRRGRRTVADVLAEPPPYLLRDLYPGRPDDLVWEPFRELVETRYEVLLHIDGRDPRGAPVRPAGYYISPRIFVPFAAPWLRSRPGPGLVLYRRVVPPPGR